MDPRSVTRRLPWIGLGLVVVGGIVFFARYAAITVLVTTLEEYPAGTTCLVDRWAGSPQQGQVLMIELGEYRILTRVTRNQNGSLWIEHQGTDSIASGAEASPIDQDDVLGALVTAFAPDQAEAPVSDGAAPGVDNADPSSPGAEDGR